MEYKIRDILHAGIYGRRGLRRTDGRYPLRIGRIVDLDLNCIEEGKPLFIEYLRDVDGTDYNKRLLTSNVVKMKTLFEDDDFDDISVETKNSIFIFEKC